VRVDRCNNIGDFRSMARRRLPGPIFHYIDGAADDEVTYRRNTEAYERCDLVPTCSRVSKVLTCRQPSWGRK
jgi:L-lactate dehydrogenase (cytochrome)